MDGNETRIAALPFWHGDVDLAPLFGGLSNLSYLATDRSGKYVVRIARDFPFHQVYREREVVTARAAHAAGFAPELVHAEPGLMVSRYVEGRALTAPEVRAGLPQIANLLARFHRDMPAHIGDSRFAFQPARANRDYLDLLDGHLNAGELNRWRTLNDEMAAAAQLDLPTIFGHHDLLAANFIDDGTRLWLIDYEYAGFGTPMFDLANLSSNAAFSADESRQLLEAYFGKRPDAAMLRAHAAMQCVSLLREMLWSHVSAIHLDAPGADYAGYAAQNHRRLEAAITAGHSDLGGA
ncbi:MAG: phosphotransferase [Devosia sp.]